MFYIIIGYQPNSETIPWIIHSADGKALTFSIYEDAESHLIYLQDTNQDTQNEYVIMQVNN